MSVLAWFEGKVGDEYETARWVHEQNTARIAEGNVVALVEQVAALFGTEGVFCSRPLAGFLGKQEVLNDAFEELRVLVRTMPDDDNCGAVLAAIEKHRVPIHFVKRREQYEAAKAARVEAITIELRDRFATCSVVELVDAASKLMHRDSVVFGFKVAGDGVPWGDLLDAGVARIQELLPTLPDAEAVQVIERFRNQPAVDFDCYDVERAIEERAHRATLATDGIDEPRNAALEAAIIENPDDENAYAVLGDFLQRQGHPRGELIALQLRAETEPNLVAEAHAFLAANAGALLGSLAAHQLTNGNEPGPALTWRRGYIDRLKVALAIYPHVPITAAQLIERAFRHPAGQFIRAVDLGIGHRSDTPTALAALIAHTGKLVTEINVGRIDIDLDPTVDDDIEDVSPLWMIPSLRSTKIFGTAQLGDIEHARLECAIFESDGMRLEMLERIVEARVPNLRKLDLYLYTPYDDGAEHHDCVRRLLARTDLPKLTHLALRNASQSDALCDALVRSPIAAQLRVLDVSTGTLSDRSARALAAGARSFPNLERLVVGGYALPVSSRDILKAAFRNASVEDESRGTAGR